MMMKVAIIGSRSYTNSRKVKEFIHKLKESLDSPSPHDPGDEND